ncbi:MAG: SHOCT domain-containing protein [Methylophaga sp.]|nr:SHOCT domain-containing protein [Methylophaga sp.]
MGIGMWLFWIILIVIILLIVKAVASNNSAVTSNQSAIEILKERFARGEIDEEEFARRKRELEK